MDKNSQAMVDRIEQFRQEILDAERYIWKNPEPGYKEWKTNAYLKEKYEALGYELHMAGNIPGFWCEADTGRPGPCIGIFGEMDSLIVPNHPECDPETGAAHSCGHHCQSAALLGVAAALKAPGALDGLCGKVRLFAVPAEELIDLDLRHDLVKKGIIRFCGGKQEFLYRGYLNGVDIGIMIHTSSNDRIQCDDGSNGCVIKTAEFRGKSCHASAPHRGQNALYAANCALNAANAIRETFRDQDGIRFHPIITAGGNVVNAIPDRVVVESYVRGRDMEAIAKENEKLNRAFAASAAAMGCNVHLSDQHGYAPRNNDFNLQDVMVEAATGLLPPEKIVPHNGWGAGCSDFGDVALVMPTVHPHIGGAEGASHSAAYHIVDAELACVTSAKVQARMAAILLADGAAKAKKVIAESHVPCKSIEEYLKMVAPMEFDADAVCYNDDGTVTLKYKN